MANLLFKPMMVGRAQVTPLATYDALIVLGDFNYRVNGNLSAICEAMKQNMFEVLHSNDQLFFEMKIGRVGVGFKEGKIRFAPTYKRIRGSNEGYKLKRIPSWTDRIVYQHNAESCVFLQKSYDAQNLVTMSDHRPVFSQFLLTFDQDGTLGERIKNGDAQSVGSKYTTMTGMRPDKD